MSATARWLTFCLGCASLGNAAVATACPFCIVQQPPLAQLRQEASEVALVEFRGQTNGLRRLHVHAVIKGGGKLRVGSDLALALDPDAALQAGKLALLFGNAVTEAESIESWSAVPISEAAYLYFAKAPDGRESTAKRLQYFARYLEHSDPQIAGDAYAEFGVAPFEMVAAVANQLSMKALRSWLLDDAVPPERRRFYAMALGLAKSSDDRRQNETVLARLIDQPADDFRAGFDGVLGGYLLLTGARGLDYVEQRLLRANEPREGDLRHAVTALRFYRQFGHAVPSQRMNKVLRNMLPRPSVAAEVITDLARAQDWESLDVVASLYTRPGFGDKAIRYAIVGYLLACPTAKAADQLAQLRQRDQAGVAAAEQQVRSLHAARQ